MKPKNQKKPMIMLPIPERAWQIISTDVFDCNNQQYLVLVDSYSGWFEINVLKETIVKILKKKFATHGVPQKLYSDNASYYMSSKLNNFASQWNFEHITSSPR